MFTVCIYKMLHPWQCPTSFWRCVFYFCYHVHYWRWRHFTIVKNFLFTHPRSNNLHFLSFLKMKFWNKPRHDKTNKVTVHPAKTQISLDIRQVWSESSLCAQRVAKDPSFLHADSEDSDQTGLMPSMIWVFAGRTITLLVCHVAARFFELVNHMDSPVRYYTRI